MPGSPEVPASPALLVLATTVLPHGEPLPDLPVPVPDAFAVPSVQSFNLPFSDFIARRLQSYSELPVSLLGRSTEPELSAPPANEKYRLTAEGAREFERGRASWYGGQFHGRRTASGETYDKYALTAAHKTLPFGTIVRVRSLALGREVHVRINDRGPFLPGRVIDVSQAAAQLLGLTGLGVADVSLDVAAALGETALLPRSGKKAIRRAVRSQPGLPRP